MISIVQHRFPSRSMLRYFPDPSVLPVLPDPLHAMISTWSYFLPLLFYPSLSPWCIDTSIDPWSIACIHPSLMSFKLYTVSSPITCILCIHILKLINTLDHVAPAPVAHAYPLLPDLSLEQPNLEIIFIGLSTSTSSSSILSFNMYIVQLCDFYCSTCIFCTITPCYYIASHRKASCLSIKLTHPMNLTYTT